MRNYIEIVESFTRLTEKVSDLFIHSGWNSIGGKPIMSDLRLWENPLRQEFESAINHCWKMSGDPNLRGFAHAGKVYVWDAELSTHAGVLEALGLHDKTVKDKYSGDSLVFDYANPAFCFFMVYGGDWQENPSKPIVVSYNGVGDNLSVLQATTARRWTKVRYVNGGAFMGG
jgi:hypothetical protein